MFLWTGTHWLWTATHDDESHDSPQLFVTKITEHLYIIMRLADENLKKNNKYFDLWSSNSLRNVWICHFHIFCNTPFFLPPFILHILSFLFLLGPVPLKMVNFNPWFSQILSKVLGISLGFWEPSTYPSPKPSFCPKREVSVNVSLGNR